MRVNSPAGIAGAYDVGLAAFGSALTAGGVTGNVVQALESQVLKNARPAL